MNVTKDLYAYLWQDPYENNCNTYVISGDKTILIDPGHSRFLPAVFSQMEEDGLSPDRIDLVLITHSHPDHLEGVEAFLDRPVKIALNHDEERYLAEGGKYLFEMMRQALPRLRVDFYLKEGEFHVGEKTFRIYQTPGHSPGSLSVHWPEQKVLLTGDVVFYGGVGRTDFPEGDMDALAKSIERLSRLDIEILLPGHGEIVLGKKAVIENFESIRQSFFAFL